MKKYDVFISYSRKDKAFAQSVCQVFDAYKKYYKFEYFFDTSEIVIKNEYLERMAIAISQSKSMLFIASKNSYSSRFCTKELLYADEYGVGIYRYCLDKSKAPQKIDFLLIDQHYLEVELCPIEEMVRQVLSETLKQDIKPLSELQKVEEDVKPAPKPKILIWQRLRPKSKDLLKIGVYILVFLSLILATVLIAKKTGTDQKSFLNIAGFDMVFVKGGTFTMGATAEQGSDADSDEKPTHSVTVSDFYIGKYEVTQAQWRAVMGSNPSIFKGDNLPVDNVSYKDIEDFIEKLNAQTGKRFRLPTEAEWEYAARGGNKSKDYKFSGGDDINKVAWWQDNSSSNTQPVGQKRSNELGVYDMSGNVWEWCQDWEGSYSSGPITNPTGPSSGKYRVLRGGGWHDIAGNCRVSCRSSYNPVVCGSYFGFRLVMEPEPDFNYLFGDETMVFVKGGTFTMGATAEQGSDAFDDERPIHSVKVSDFYIGKYEVTQAQWYAVMGSNSSHFKGDNLPVDNVSYKDIEDFIEKLNAQTGKKFRLPTEAEWEYAARGGSQSKGYKYSGSDSISEVACYKENSGGKTCLVGKETPNELGIYDMTGNVWEWCQDWYGSYSGGMMLQINPKGPSAGNYRVLRGGSWYNNARSCRISNRGSGSPDRRNSNYGFRLACYSE